MTAPTTYHSQMKIGNSNVPFPAWQGDRHYMLPFTPRNGLPQSVRRFQATADAMLAGTGVDLDQECYIMVDEKDVDAGQYHRRPGLHVDGYWHPATEKHGGGHGPKYRGRSAAGAHELVLLASNHSAARALIGTYERDFMARWDGGDCSDLPTNGLHETKLAANVAYHLDVFTLHESLPLMTPVRRTVVRINVPNTRLS